MIIVGGGPAGLSAALVLGRSRRRVLVIDDGKPRNAASDAAHGFFTRDGAAPRELRRIAREQLRPYEVRVLDARVEDARAVERGFEVATARGERFRGRRLLMATGLRDLLPERQGFADYLGRGVYHCPYCDGWEVRDRRLAAYGTGGSGAREALGLRQWSERVVLLTDGPARLNLALAGQLQRNGVEVEARRIERLEGKKGRLWRVRFLRGEPLEVDALFFTPRFAQRSPLPERLGCSFTPHGVVGTGKNQKTRVQGLYVAGDAARDVQQISVAAAEGAKAAIEINKSLTTEDLA